MENRPDLNCDLASSTFREYYYLKEELVDFCRKQGLPSSGGKEEIADRIAYYLDTGKVKPAKVTRKKKSTVEAICEDSEIESDFVCSEVHRAFFKEHIGTSFSFNVIFQKWLKSNSGKTYRDAIEAYYRILEEKKHKATTIDRQFEYNTYIRDFFEDNKGKSLDEAIACWKYKKQQKGHNRYEREDLAILKK